jgi:putative membrane protein
MIKKAALGLLLNGAALYLTQHLIGEVSIGGGLITYVYAAIIIGAINLFVKPVLKIVTLPVKYLTLGLSLILINVFVFYLSDQALELLFGLKHDLIVQEDLVTYIKSGIIFGAINWLEHLIIK